MLIPCLDLQYIEYLLIHNHRLLEKHLLHLIYSQEKKLLAPDTELNPIRITNKINSHIYLKCLLRIILNTYLRIT